MSFDLKIPYFSNHQYPFKKGLALALCVGFLSLTNVLCALPAQVIIIKYAEKSADGMTLSLKGKERAAALAPFLMETKDFTAYGQPVAIYAAGASKDNGSLRAIDTIKPLADALRLTIRDIYTKDDFKALVNEIYNEFSYNGRTVLISWDAQTMPELARAFKAFQTPAKVLDNLYDRVWVITFINKDKVSFQNLPQKLLFGDTSN